MNVRMRAAPDPWWLARVAALLAPEELGALTLGALWRLSEELERVRQAVDLRLLPLDLVQVPAAPAAWAAYQRRSLEVAAALAHAGGQLAGRMRGGHFAALSFRAHWEGLGFVPHADGAGTPADDFLDGAFGVSRLAPDEAPPPLALLNLASRAGAVADFLAVTAPGAGDVVMDLGSGSGKLALTVAASSAAQVRGVELVPAYVAAARRSAYFYGLASATFVEADAREVDLSAGTIFYLYYPFRGAVAEAVCAALGTAAQARPITIYASGPAAGYGEHFLAQVARGALRLDERRGEFGEVMVLRSAGP